MLPAENKDFDIYLSAAIFSDATATKFSLNEDIRRMTENLQGQLRNISEDSKDDKMRVMFDTGAANHVCPFWFGESFPLTRGSQKVTSASGTEIEVYGWRTASLLLKESPRRCFMPAFLICVVTTPILPFPQLLQQSEGCSMGKKDLKDCMCGKNPAPIVNLGQHVYTEPVGFCNDFENHPCVIFPNYSGKPAAASPAFARSSMKRGPGGTTGYWELFVEPNSIRRAHKIPRRALRAQRQDPSKPICHGWLHAEQEDGHSSESIRRLCLRGRVVRNTGQGTSAKE